LSIGRFGAVTTQKASTTRLLFLVQMKQNLDALTGPTQNSRGGSNISSQESVSGSMKQSIPTSYLLGEGFLVKRVFSILVELMAPQATKQKNDDCDRF